MGFLQDTANRIVENVTQSLRHFTSFIFLVYAIGVLIGMHVANSGNAEYQLIAVGAPIALAALAYVSTAFAVAVFIAVALLLFLL